MERNTNLDEVLFPVGFADVFIEGMTEGEYAMPVKIPVENYRAIINQSTGNVLSVVSKHYKLITNEQAFEFGKECYKNVFNVKSTSNFEVFNVIISSTLTYCLIDIIMKGYQVNIWKQEIFLPFIRITNSYNRTRKLSFDLGFCRKLCDNGVIFEKETIRFSFYHTKKIIKNGIHFDILPNKLETLRRKFMDYTEKLNELPVPQEKALPLMCKILNIKFNLEKKDKELEIERKRRDEFKQRAEGLIDSYYHETGANAYSVFNACTDFASHSKTGKVNFFADSMQKKIGNWIEKFAVEREKTDFSLADYIKDFDKYLN